MNLDSSLSAVVTGGASGLGAATATALRALGVKVAIFDKNPETGERKAAEIGALFCQVDVMDEASVDAGFAKARAAHGQERVLVNCAGGGRPGGKTVSRNKETGAIVRHKTEDFEWTLGLNTVGTFRCITAAAAGMLTLDPLSEDGDRGAIVNTGSVAAQDGQIGQVAYSAAKAAIAGMTLTIARDLSSEGIRVNTILPGIMATPPMLSVRERAPQIWQSLNASVPFPRRLGHPEEFADLALTMLRNGYFNGQVVRLDGAIRMPPR
ncbi:SDR family NAD(P)-dependent oxidoreductase [Phenylobacterium montanum]|uniref:SDR family NAD(P)-dependent oxidoreductase n=1 Tax=Phenylobacterium montanum TaxID=2823693 RepID=A0A975G288_9CAUL|nr:SDR family NAD(P)-dependent oxidoreductase [Caulobacter sp. S6]QUD89361.1 SDR family NAD(P)-dependent oxidoreductase [Caulobacter sp. S6]